MTEEDDAELTEIWKKIQARRDSEVCAQGPDEQGAESDGSDEGPSEDSKGDES